MLCLGIATPAAVINGIAAGTVVYVAGLRVLGVEVQRVDLDGVSVRGPGEILCRAGKVDEAKKTLEEVLKADPEHPEAKKLLEEMEKAN